METAEARRVNWARVAPAAIVVVAVISVLIDLVSGLQILIGRSLFGGDELALIQAPQFPQADLDAGVSSSLADATVGLRVACALPSAVEVLLIVGTAVLLFGIVRRIATMSAFAAAVIRRWQVLAVLLVVGGVALGVLNTIVTEYLDANVLSANRAAQVAFLGGHYTNVSIAGPEWPFPIVALGIVAAAIAVAFRSGAELERQTTGVI